MSIPPAPKFVVIDNLLPDDVIEGMESLVTADEGALRLQDFGGLPADGHYSALRKLWVCEKGLGAFKPVFCKAIMNRFQEICAGTGIAPFAIAEIETEVCAQKAGSYFAKHIDTDTREASRSRTTDRLISSVFYFPREPLAFSGGELIIYDFTGESVAGRIAPRRNRLVAFPSFAYHEVTPVFSGGDDVKDARWSVNCWLHRARAS